MNDSEAKLQLNIAMCCDHFQHRDRLLLADDITPQDLFSKNSGSDKKEFLLNKETFAISESNEASLTSSNRNQNTQNLQESAVSLASTNNTDICVLETHYGEDEAHNEYLDTDLDQSNFINDKNLNKSDSDGINDDVFHKYVNVLEKQEDFTMVQKPLPHHHQMNFERRNQCKCDESTEVLMLINSDYPDVLPKSTYSTTDSDVEVLMSEEIIESDWSSEPLNPLQAGNVRPRSPNLQQKTTNPDNTETENSPSCLADSCEEVSSSQRPLFSDLDILDDEDVEHQKRVSSLALNKSDYRHLNRSQLLDIIQEQELQIQSLEAIVQRYHRAQQRLFEHVDALRLELNDIKISSISLNRPIEGRKDWNQKTDD